MNLFAILYWTAYTACLVLWLAGTAFVGVSGWVFFWAALIPMACVIAVFLVAVLVIGIGHRFR